MTDRDRAGELARTMVRPAVTTAQGDGRPERDGHAPRSSVGNALEVAESVECVGRNDSRDLIEITLALGPEMLGLAGSEADPAVRSDGSASNATGRWSWPKEVTPTPHLPSASHRSCDRRRSGTVGGSTPGGRVARGGSGRAEHARRTRERVGWCRSACQTRRRGGRGSTIVGTSHDRSSGSTGREKP